MNVKLQKISQLTRKIPIVIPPGSYDDYPKSGITYQVNTDNHNEYLADNPYIIEYLLYNQKEAWIQDVSHMYYLGIQSLKQSKSDSSFFLFFTDKIAHLLDFEITQKELPVFKIFLDHIAFQRKETHKKNGILYFPWKYSTFQKYAASVTHSINEKELFLFHQRLCNFQKELFPEEALSHLFDK